MDTYKKIIMQSYSTVTLVMNGWACAAVSRNTSKTAICEKYKRDIQHNLPGSKIPKDIRSNDILFQTLYLIEPKY